MSEFAILDYLYQEGDLSSATLRLVKTYMTKWQVPAIQAVLDTHVTSEERLADVIAEKTGLERLSGFDAEQPTSVVLNKWGRLRAKEWQCLPLRFLEDEKAVLCAVTLPEMPGRREVVSQVFECAMIEAICERRELMDAIDRLYDPPFKQSPHDPTLTNGDSK